MKSLHIGLMLAVSLAGALWARGDGEGASKEKEARLLTRRNAFGEAAVLYEEAAAAEQGEEARWRYRCDAMNAYGRAAEHDKRIALAERYLAEEGLSASRRAMLLGQIRDACQAKRDYTGHFTVAIDCFRAQREALSEIEDPDQKVNALLGLIRSSLYVGPYEIDRFETAIEAGSVPGASPKARIRALKEALRMCDRNNLRDYWKIGAKRAKEVDSALAAACGEMAEREKKPAARAACLLAAADHCLAHDDGAAAADWCDKALAIEDLPVERRAAILLRSATCRAGKTNAPAIIAAVEAATALPGLPAGSRADILLSAATACAAAGDAPSARTFSASACDLPGLAPDDRLAALWRAYRLFDKDGDEGEAMRFAERIRRAEGATALDRYQVDLAFAGLLQRKGKGDEGGKLLREAQDRARKTLSGKELFDCLLAQAIVLRKGASGDKARSDRLTAIERAREAIAVEGGFDKRKAYDFIGDVYCDLAAWQAKTGDEAEEFFGRFIAIKERVWTDREKMGLATNEAARTYYDISRRIMRHSGRPARDPARARIYYEKGVALGAGPRGGNLAEIEEIERKEAALANFPDRQWRKTVEPAFRDLDKRLSKGKTVHAKDFGWDKEDATHALQAALDSDASVVIVDDMGSPWYVETIRMRSNKKIIFRRGVEIIAKRYAFRGVNLPLFSFFNVGDILLEGEGREPVLCRMWKEDYLGDKEHYPFFTDTRNCIAMVGGRNIRIRNCKFASSGGDGICTSYSPGEINTSNLWLDRCVFEDNVRQGLSICSGSTYLYLTDCAFNRSWGGEPMSGIDVEPWCEAFEVRDIYVEGCKFLGNRIDGIVIMNSTRRPFSFFAKGCFFEGNRHNCVNIQMRAGVPTVNKILFEDCEFRQSRDSQAITVGRSFTGNTTFRNCRIVQSGGVTSGVDASPILFATDMARQDLYAPGETVFDGLAITGYEKEAPIALRDRNGTTMLKGVVRGDLIVNGRKRSVDEVLAEEGYDKRHEVVWEPAVCDFARLGPPPSDTAIDAFIPAPYGGGYSILFYRAEGQVISLGVFSRITQWTSLKKKREAIVRLPDGTTESLGPLDRTSDNTHFTYRAPMTGFYEISSPDWGFFIPSDDKLWRYSYRATASDGFVTCNYNSFTGVFEVPAGTRTVTMQAYGFRAFRLFDADGRVVGEAGRTPGLKTFSVKRKDSSRTELWYFLIDHGAFRFFAPMNGVFADCAANLPRAREAK